MKLTESEFYRIIDALESHSRTYNPPNELILHQIIGANPMSFLDKIMDKGSANMRKVNQLKFEVATKNLTIKLLENKGKFVETIPRTEPKAQDDPERNEGGN